MHIDGNPVPGRLDDPVLQLHDENGLLITTNDNWKDEQWAEIEATGLAPTDDRESATMRTLAPGACTAVVRGRGDSTGIAWWKHMIGMKALIRSWPTSAPRGFVETDDNVMIGGFIGGPGNRSKPAGVVRAIGPSLTTKGVPDALQDPILELHDANGATIASNDDWASDPNADKVAAAGLAPSDPRESAIRRRARQRRHHRSRPG